MESQSRHTLQKLRNARTLRGDVGARSGLVCWTDPGVRWARLVGHRWMLERIS